MRPEIIQAWLKNHVCTPRNWPEEWVKEQEAKLQQKEQDNGQVQSR